VPDGAGEELRGHYEADFLAPDGTVVHRYLTDKGRAWLLQLVDGGRRELTPEELRRNTVGPDLDELVAKMEHESGDGA